LNRILFGSWILWSMFGVTWSREAGDPRIVLLILLLFPGLFLLGAWLEVHVIYKGRFVPARYWNPAAGLPLGYGLGATKLLCSMIAGGLLTLVCLDLVGLAWWRHGVAILDHWSGLLGAAFAGGLTAVCAIGWRQARRLHAPPRPR
jgi:hypothetical protein